MIPPAADHFPKTEKAPNYRGFFLLIQYYLPALSLRMSFLSLRMSLRS
jgi:hypothetical protein